MSSTTSNNKINSLWVEKYRPRNSKDIIGNVDNVALLKKWMSDYKKKDPNIKRAVLISGPPGQGKSTMAQVLGEEEGFDVIEYNASDTRSRKSIQDGIAYTVSHQNVSKVYGNTKPFLLIMDEVDGMSTGDKGGLSELVQLINPIRGRHSIKKSDRNKASSRWIPPIICICNNRYSKNINELAKECLEIKFRPPTTNDLRGLASKIIVKEKVNITKKALDVLIEHVDGDIRQLVSLLYEMHMLGYKVGSGNIASTLEIFAEKDKDIGLYESVGKLLTNKLSMEDSLNYYEFDKSLIPLMMQENYPDYISDWDLDRMVKISDILVKSDLIEREIYSHQTWNLQSIHGVLSTSATNYYLNEGQNLRSKGIRFTTVLGKMSTYSSKRNAYIALKEKLRNLDSPPSYFLEFFKSYLLDKLLDPAQQSEGVDIMIHYDLISYDKEQKISLRNLDMLCKIMDFNDTIDYKKKLTAKTKTQIKKVYEAKMAELEKNKPQINIFRE